MICYLCSVRLTEDEVGTHTCATTVQDTISDGKSLYHRLTTPPFVSIQSAFASTVSDETAPQSPLRVALSSLLHGPPLPLHGHKGLLHPGDAKRFEAIATSVLNRVKDPDNENGDYHHYATPPFPHRLLTAVLREVNHSQHAVALLVALAVDDKTRHLTSDEAAWERLDVALLSGSPLPSSPLLQMLEDEISRVELRHGEMDDLARSLSFLFSSREEYVITVLHTLLLSTRGSQQRPIALPPVSGGNSWVPRMLLIVASCLERSNNHGGHAVRQAVSAAVRVVNDSPLDALAVTRLARGVPVAVTMEHEECSGCCLYWPVDAMISCGARVLCKVCFETAALSFAAQPSGAADTCRHYVQALMMFHPVIGQDVRHRLGDAIDSVRIKSDFDCRFHCPLNYKHQVPFHTDMPDNPIEPGKPVGICCPGCSITWCSQCPNAFHPHATSCADVISRKCQWDVIAAGMKAAANAIVTVVAVRKPEPYGTTEQTVLDWHRRLVYSLRREPFPQPSMDSSITFPQLPPNANATARIRQQRLRTLTCS